MALGKKRKELTADDLLRREETLSVKRQKTTSQVGKRRTQKLDSEPESDASGDSSDDGPLLKDGDGDDGSDAENVEDSEDDQSSDVQRQPLDEQSSTRIRADTSGAQRKIVDNSQEPLSLPKKTPSFTSLGISDPIVRALANMSIKLPTEVQAACIPPMLAGKDCIGNAKTGSGKTFAFALPIIQSLSKDPYGIYALVLTPTRELAFQISEQFAVIGSALNVKTSIIVGGMDMMAQAIDLRNRPHVVIATPGRIVDHLRSSTGEWDLSRVKYLILDEADRLLTSTFAPDLSYLFGVLPKERQTCLFTATLTPAVEKIADATPRAGKQKPFVHRMLSSVETVETLKQSYLLLPSHIREPYLFYLLCNPPKSVIHLRRAPPEPTKPAHKQKHLKKPLKKPSKAPSSSDSSEIIQPPPTIIFCARTRTAAYLTSLLRTLGIRSTALHSKITQRARLNSLSLFRSRMIPVLITTDVGARGLDIDDVAMVINWDIPREPEEYTHRVGRTARMGKDGIAISFVTERDEDSVLAIENRINTKLEEMTLPEEKVLEKLNAVSTAKRLANMELHDSNFGQREEIHKKKKGRLDSERPLPVST
ncbi:DEAD-domain-containing protein [Sistotremastrum niveocremeum HHB9708]|uniref:DEAD-domain-containing protein n=1 Tax=Sistotremastrum niveocremeum HHB9708 TaxID=1314777 RepID=A0A164S9P6_9AGAM|nr:DEAD-domain-containing protein [Sistotremastrum niveocremeum HHB9708]